MTMRSTAAVVIVVLGIGLPACGRTQDEAPATSELTVDQPGAPDGLDITFASEPDPPATGENTFAVTVKQPDGTPVTDATVTAEFFMPAMPEMKMAEMRTTTTLTHEGEGRYRGRGQVMMAGPWDVTVNVNRGGQTIGSRKVSVTAK